MFIDKLKQIPKKIWIGIATLSFVLLIILIMFTSKIWGENVTQNQTVYITNQDSFETVVTKIAPYLESESDFRWIASLKKYTKRIKGGRYFIKKGMSNNQLLNLLRSGNQTPVKVSFNNIDSFEELAGNISKQIEADSISLLNAFTDTTFQHKHKLTKEQLIGVYIPNTYEFYWNTSAVKFRDRLYNEYKKYWTPARLEKANSLNLTPFQVATIASIVQKETSHIPERSMVAGLYLNRYKNKWPLQADPTVIYSAKQLDEYKNTIIKRVLFKHLEIESPYNTYLIQGLPPGPISMPEISALEAVLNPASHDYFYMCASIEKIGTHAFAKNSAQHQRNARKYQQWLNKQGIRK